MLFRSVVTSRRSDHRPSVRLSGLGVPVIYVFSHSDDDQALTLLPDDEGGARLAVAHLIAGGRRRIAHISGPAHFEAVLLRQAGYAATMVQADMAPLPVLHGSWSEAWGRAAVGQVLNGATPPPDAIFCGNDQIARGAADALREAGLSVPHDIALVGFDNWNVMVEASRPPLSSIDMRLTELGAEAGRRMLVMVGGERQQGLERLPCALVLRDSSAMRRI